MTQPSRFSCLLCQRLRISTYLSLTQKGGNVAKQPQSGPFLRDSAPLPPTFTQGLSFSRVAWRDALTTSPGFCMIIDGLHGLPPQPFPAFLIPPLSSAHTDPSTVIHQQPQVLCGMPPPLKDLHNRESRTSDRYSPSQQQLWRAQGKPLAPAASAGTVYISVGL